MEILTQPVLEKGIKKAQEQFRKGNYVVFDDKFLNSF